MNINIELGCHHEQYMMRNSLFITIFFLFSIACSNNAIQSQHSEAKTITPGLEATQAKQTRESLPADYECEYDNEVSTLGIGVVMAPSKFEMYHDSLLSKKYGVMDIYSGENKLAICSKFYKPDYGIMHFIGVSSTSKSFAVLITDVDIKYLPKENNYRFKTWKEYILESYGIRRKYHTTAQPLKKEPDDNADSLTIPKGLELFCPMEIEGDWVKVQYDCFYNAENNGHEGEPCHAYVGNCKDPLVGWLKWRKENHLLIDIFLMP